MTNIGGTTTTRGLSALLAIEDLTEQSRAVEEARSRFEKERSERDRLIKDARRARIPVAEVMRLTGLSRDRVYKICAGGER